MARRNKLRPDLDTGAAEGKKQFEQNQRKIFLFSDGTGNSSSKFFKTNVWRLYDSLDFQDIDQISFYDDGVGTSSFKPMAIIGGAFGIGMARNVKNIYAFLCRNYQAGDKIYCFGFSRGAFTIRVLLNLIESEGIVKYHRNKPNAEARLAADVNAAYRSFLSSRNKFGLIAWPARTIRSGLSNLISRFSGLEPYSRDKNFWAEDKSDTGETVLIDRETRQLLDWKSGGSTQNNHFSDIPVAFVGLWDTVEAYGLPIEELTRAWDKYFWPLSIDTLHLPENVVRGRHALAIDDERNTFHPVLWQEDGENEGENRTSRKERIFQVWFAGSHSDVGGGYPDDRLSRVSLTWMIDELKSSDQGQVAIKFNQSKLTSLSNASDSCGLIHDSRRGLGSYYRYNPRNIEQISMATHEPKDHEHRLPRIHYSVFERMLVGVDGYAPFNLPAQFQVVGRKGELINPHKDRLIQKKSGLKTEEIQEIMEKRTEIQDVVWDFVWSRRVAFYSTFALSLLIFFLPFFANETLIKPGETSGACLSQSAICPVSNIFGWIGGILPSFAQKWLRTYQSNPLPTLLLLSAILILNMMSSIIATKIRDIMRPIINELSYFIEIRSKSPWIVKSKRHSKIPSIKSVTDVYNEALLQRRFYHIFINGMRKSEPYQWFWRVISHKLIPFTFCLSAAYLFFAFVIQMTGIIKESSGYVCLQNNENKTNSASELVENITFDIRNECQFVNFYMKQGATYNITMTVPANTPWIDGGTRVGLYGVIPERVGWLTSLLQTPLRRHISENWAKPVLRIGATGNDVYPLNPAPSLHDDPGIYHPFDLDDPKDETCSPRDLVARSYNPKHELQRIIDSYTNNPKGDSIYGAGKASCKNPWGGNAQDLILRTSIVARSPGPVYLYVNGSILPIAFPALDKQLTDNFLLGGSYTNNLGSALVTIKKIIPQQQATASDAEPL